MTLRGNPIQFVCSLLAISVLASLADAGEPEAKQSETDKSGFSLFNPTPSKLLREMTTDGPERFLRPFLREELVRLRGILQRRERGWPRAVGGDVRCRPDIPAQR